MAKILIVEDDEFMRDILRDYLVSKGYHVNAVPNGRVAQDVVLGGGFDLVISDVQMPHMNGVEFLQWLRKESSVPFMLMTGFTHLMETKKAADCGADGFLSKPFSNQELLQQVQTLLKGGSAGKQNAPTTDSDFCKVPIDEIAARPKIEFDIYVRLTRGQLLKVGKAGQTIDLAQLKAYKASGIQYLLIRQQDFNKFVSFSMSTGQGKVA